MAPAMRRMAHLGGYYPAHSTITSTRTAMKGPPHQQTGRPRPTADLSEGPIMRAAAHHRDHGRGVQTKPVTKDNYAALGSVMSTRIKLDEVASPTTSTVAPLYETASIPQAESRVAPDVLPNIPAWLTYMIFMFFLLGFMMSMLLYCVNFPRKFAGFEKRKASSRRHEYETIKQHNLVVDGHNGEGHTAISPVGSGYQPKTTPVPGSSTPQELHYRRQNKSSLVGNPQATDVGLGLVAPAIRTSAPSHGPMPHDDRAADDTYDPEATSWRPLTASIHSNQSLLNSSWTLADNHHEHSQEHDLETGRPNRNKEWLEPSPAPSPSVSGSSRSSSSSQVRILAMLGNGVERAADRFARILDDQVKDGDAEGGLLLSVQDCERERWPPLEMRHVGNAKKRC